MRAVDGSPAPLGLTAAHDAWVTRVSPHRGGSRYARSWI